MSNATIPLSRESENSHSGNPLKFLIVGGSGYVGKHLFEKTGPERAVATWYRHAMDGGVHLAPDSDDLAAFIRHHGPFSHAVILHGITHIETCHTDKNRSQKVNVEGIKRLILALLDVKIKPIFASTEQVFDGKTGGYTESDPTDPLCTYGKQKVEVENFLQSLGCDYAIFRLSKVYGAHLNDGTILSNWLDDIQNNRLIRCATDQRFAPIFIDDVTSAFLQAVDANHSGIFHLCGPEHLSRADMLHILLDHLKARFNMIQDVPIEYCLINDFKFSETRPIDISMNPKKWIETSGLVLHNMETVCKQLVNALPSRWL